jgi:hypothetical protein
LQQVVLVAAQCAGREDFLPHGLLQRLLAVVGAMGGFYRDGRCVVAGEMAGVDIKTGNPPRPAQADDAPVVSVMALAAGFPAIHPFAVFVVFTGYENGGFRVEHACQRGKEFITGIQAAGANARVGQIDGLAGPVRQQGRGGSQNRVVHGVSLVL